MAYGKILVGVDGSETSLAALAYAHRLAKADAAELVVVAAGRRSGAPDAEDAMRPAREAVQDPGVPVSFKAVPGKPAEALVEAAERESADLLVVGSKGMEGAHRFLLGSVPDEISHHAPCDLLIVKTA